MTEFAEERRAALGNQHWNASWMAFNRGDRLTALRYLARAWRLDHVSPRGAQRAWAPLLFRYIAGRRVDPDVDFSCEDGA